MAYPGYTRISKNVEVFNKIWKKMCYQILRISRNYQTKYFFPFWDFQNFDFFLDDIHIFLTFLLLRYSFSKFTIFFNFRRRSDSQFYNSGYQSRRFRNHVGNQVGGSSTSPGNHRCPYAPVISPKTDSGHLPNFPNAPPQEPC